MNSTLSRTRSEISTGLWGTEPPVDATLHPADLDRLPSKRPSLGKRASRALARFVITRRHGQRDDRELVTAA